MCNQPGTSGSDKNYTLFVSDFVCNSEFELPCLLRSKHVKRQKKNWLQFCKVVSQNLFQEGYDHNLNQHCHNNHLIIITNILHWRAISQESKCFMLHGQSSLSWISIMQSEDLQQWNAIFFNFFDQCWNLIILFAFIAEQENQSIVWFTLRYINQRYFEHICVSICTNMSIVPCYQM